jgi:hypothetical protein
MREPLLSLVTVRPRVGLVGVTVSVIERTNAGPSTCHSPGKTRLLGRVTGQPRDSCIRGWVKLRLCRRANPVPAPGSSMLWWVMNWGGLTDATGGVNSPLQVATSHQPSLP